MAVYSLRGLEHIYIVRNNSAVFEKHCSEHMNLFIEGCFMKAKDGMAREGDFREKKGAESTVERGCTVLQERADIGKTQKGDRISQFMWRVWLR